MGAALELLALHVPSSYGQDLLASVFTALPACDSCPAVCRSQESGPASAPRPVLYLLLLYKQDQRRLFGFPSLWVWKWASLALASVDPI